MTSCGICLISDMKIPKTCEKCKMVACEKCIITWYETSHRKSVVSESAIVPFTCPQCRAPKSFGINTEQYTHNEVDNGVDYCFRIGDIINPNFFDAMPNNIKNMHEFVPLEMTIDNETELVGYRVVN